jgi:hypothetical protein
MTGVGVGVVIERAIYDHRPRREPDLSLRGSELRDDDSVSRIGPGQNFSALIIAVEIGPISMSTAADNNYNYMQFRTSFSGVEIVSVSIGAAPRITRRQPGHFQSE